jgi:hypothetical protein
VRGPGWLIAAVRRATGAAWRALPGDLLGRVVLNACQVPARSGRLVPRGGLAPSGEATLVEDPRLALFLDVVPLRPGAVTLGRYILARGPLAGPVVRHELEHVRQWSGLGPLFLPLYLAESALQMLRGGDRYLDNRFERVARARERPATQPTALSPEPG